VNITESATTRDRQHTPQPLISCMAPTGRPQAQLAAIVQRLPQVMINVRVADRESVAASPDVRAAVADAEAELGEDGRILLRPSGTEQLVRVMVEAASQEHAERIARRVSEVVGAV
jgi:phosphoglucosamine mutase